MTHFTNNELNNIKHALSYYIDQRTDELSQQNSRDEDWDRLSDYQSLNHKIINYIIEMSQPCID